MRRVWIVASIVAAGLFGVGHGAEVESSPHPVWLQAPDRADWAKAYPAAAAQAGVEGRVRLACTATSVGRLDHCSTLEETPTGQGFAAAALQLASGMQLADTLSNGQPSAGKPIVVPVHFTPGVLAQHAAITNPDWQKKPRGEDFSSLWPTAARGGSGKATVHCIVTNRGLLEKCQVAAEFPANQGFGHAAMLMTASFLMRPMTVDGQPVGGAEISIPINWVAPPGGVGVGGPSIHVANRLAWAQAPTAADMAAAFPRSAIGKVATGHVVLRCRVNTDGGLSSCETVTQDPEGYGFSSAAIRLSRSFKVMATPEALKAAKDLYVNLTFDFRDPDRPGPPLEIVDPYWLTQINPDAAARLFPKAATDAGLHTGRGVVLCQIAQNGGLKDCAVVAEDPPGLGFGAAAVTLAQSMVMNPWSQQGAPVEGARVRLPIRLNLVDPPPEAASRAPPPKP